MVKIIALILAVSATAFAQPRAIHWSAVGDYLVDENGKKTKIEGHPKLTCHLSGQMRVTGRFFKARGQRIWLQSNGKYIELPKPVCDVWVE